MKKSGFAKGVFWTLSIGIVFVIILAAVSVVAYNGYTNASLEASYSRGDKETTIKIEKKDKLSSEITSVDKKQVKFNEDLLKDKTKLNFKESGPFYGIKENGRMVRGILKGFQNKGFKTDFYGLFTKNQMYWKGYSEIKYDDGRVLYQYNEYKLDENGKVIIDEDGIYQLVDSYLISEEDFSKVRKYITYDISIPFNLYDFKDAKEQFTKKETKEKKESIFEDYGTIENDYGKYHGQIKDGKPHGYGTLTFNNGDYYRGDWEDGNKIRKGYFVFTFDNGDKYSGELYNGLFHGQGTYYFKELGHTYEGEFKNHEETFGTMNYSDGRKYIGEFKNDLKHGQGTLVFPSGKKMVGNWKNDKFLDQAKAALNITTNEKYYALVIGNNNYEYLEKLDAAENDAEVIADVLTNKYGFEVDLLLNADYDTTVNSLFKITNKLKRNDNLLIYYAGHGELDKAENRGYWLPVDASYELRSKWISNQRIVDRIKATKAKHVLLIADSCFSGTLMRSGTNPDVNEAIDEKYIERLKSKKTRLVITSGGNEPVIDSDGGDHSLFALKLIDTLKNNNTVINSQMLFENIRRYVVSNADQTPERALVHKTGHDGGDFLFFPKE